MQHVLETQDSRALNECLLNIDVTEAEAQYPEDKAMILQQLHSFGLDHFNREMKLIISKLLLDFQPKFLRRSGYLGDPTGLRNLLFSTCNCVLTEHNVWSTPPRKPIDK